MGIIQHRRHTDTDWLAKGPIGPYVDAFKQHLMERRYAAHTFTSYVVDVTHFARWAHSKRLRLNRVDEAAIA
jgi:site-specific recombinase XerD